MPPIISEFLRFTVKSGFNVASPAFTKLRKDVVANGVKEQYFGTDTDSPDTLVWVIRV
jgi:hypothetical protein